MPVIFLGRVGITLDCSWEEPEDPDDSTHHEASDTKIEFDFGWFAHPILVDGTYPPVMREKVYLATYLYFNTFCFTDKTN